MEHRVTHGLGRDLAKKVTAAAFEAYAAKYTEYNPKTVWTGDFSANVSFRVKGVSLEGKVEVLDKDITLDLDVPFLLRPFRSMALEVIEREIVVWIAKAKNGEIS
jgi:hypothetical protein